MSSCWGCGDELSNENIANSTCVHASCSTCFMSRMQVALKGTDRIDPFACPVCKDPGGFISTAVAGRYKEDIERAQRYAEQLWRCNIDKGTHPEDLPPVLVPQIGTLPTIVYMTYWHNKPVLLAADQVICADRRETLLCQSLVAVGDSVRARCKRSAACAALTRMHTSLGKRRRLDALVLEEARTLVDALEQEEEDHQAAQDSPAHLYMVLRMKDAETTTHLWLHADMGTAVAFALRSAVVPQWCVTLIRASNDEPPAVLATVDQNMSGPAAAKHVMSCLRGQTAGTTISQDQATLLAEQVRARDVSIDAMTTTSF